MTEPRGRRPAGAAGDDPGLDRRLRAADPLAGVLPDDDPPTFTPTDTWSWAPAKR